MGAVEDAMKAAVSKSFNSATAYNPDEEARKKKEAEQQAAAEKAAMPQGVFHEMWKDLTN